VHDRSSYVPGAYGDGYGDRQAVAAAQLAAEAPPVGAVGAAVGEMLSSSVLADEIGEKVGELLRSRGAEGTEGRKSQAMAVLDQLNDLQGGQSRDRARGSPEEELDSDSQPVGQHDDWRRQLEAEVAAEQSPPAAAYGADAYRETKPPERPARQRMMVSQSPEQELASESYLQREPDPASSALGFLAEFRSSSRDATRPGGARSRAPAGPEEQPGTEGDDGWTSSAGAGRDATADFSESDQDRAVLPHRDAQRGQPGARASVGGGGGGGPRAGGSGDADKAAKERRSEAGPEADAQQDSARRRTTEKRPRPVAAVRGESAEVVARLREERDAAVEKMQVMEERQEAFMDAQERDLLAIEQRGATQAAKLKKLTHENEDLRAEVEHYHAELGDAQSGVEGALSRQAREHERQIRALEERLAEAEQGAEGTAQDASTKLARSQAQLARELERLQTELEDEKQEALALAAEEADDRIADLSAQLRGTERTIEKMEKRLQQQTELVSSLDEEKHSFEESLIAAESQRDNAQRRAESVLAKLEAKDSDLLAQAQAADDDVAELAIKLEKTERQAEQLGKALAERESEVDDLRRELSDAQAEISGSVAAAEEKTARLLSLVETKDAEATRAAAEADSTTESLSTQLDESRAEISRQRGIAEEKGAALAVMTGERDKLRMELLQSEGRLNERNARLQSAEQHLEEATAQASSEAERATRNHNEVAMLGKKLEQSHKDLSTAREEQLASQRTLAEVRLRNETLESQARTRAQNHAQDQETLKHLKHAAEAMQTTLAEKAMQCTAAEQAADAQRASMLEMRAAGEEALARAAADSSRVETLEHELASVRQQLKDSGAGVERSGKEVQHLSLALAEARQMSEELLRRATTAERSADAATREVTSMMNEVGKLRALVAARSPQRGGSGSGGGGPGGVRLRGSTEFIESGAALPDPSAGRGPGGSVPAADTQVLEKEIIWRQQAPAPAPEPAPSQQPPERDQFAGRWKAVDQNRSSLEIGFAFGHDADERGPSRQQQQQQQQEQQAAGASTWVPGQRQASQQVHGAAAAPADGSESWEDTRYRQIRQSQARDAPPWGDTVERTAEEQFGGALHRGVRSQPLSLVERGVELPVAGMKSNSFVPSATPKVAREDAMAVSEEPLPSTSGVAALWTSAGETGGAGDGDAATGADERPLTGTGTYGNDGSHAGMTVQSPREQAREAAKAVELAVRYVLCCRPRVAGTCSHTSSAHTHTALIVSLSPVLRCCMCVARHINRSLYLTHPKGAIISAGLFAGGGRSVTRCGRGAAAGLDAGAREEQGGDGGGRR
jgi:hypothetical protein